MIIRQETKTDHDAVYSLIFNAFELAKHRDGTEQIWWYAYARVRHLFQSYHLSPLIMGKLSAMCF